MLSKTKMALALGIVWGIARTCVAATVCWTMRHWRFIPAKKSEQKLASRVEFSIRFTLSG